MSIQVNDKVKWSHSFQALNQNCFGHVVSTHMKVMGNPCFLIQECGGSNTQNMVSKDKVSKVQERITNEFRIIVCSYGYCQYYFRSNGELKMQNFELQKPDYAENDNDEDSLGELSTNDPIVIDDYCGDDYCGYEDYEPNVYDGTYSEM